jgi:hypothetical protein
MDELHKQAKATLGIAQNLRSAVKLPANEDLNEWLAVHVFISPNISRMFQFPF